VSANSAAPPGTITLTCPDSAGNTYAATIHYNPATGAFNADAITTTGSTATGDLTITLAAGGAIDLSIPGGDTVTAVTLADDGITNWGQVQNTGLTVN
jgi:hypothetical protein